MRRLTTREVRLVIVLAVIAVLALIGVAFSPPLPPNPEEVQAYYVDLFERAEVITITPTGGGEPVTVTRRDARGLFQQLAFGARYGAIGTAPSPLPPAYLLDVKRADGKIVQGVGVSYHLEDPHQPSAGKYWLFPNSPERRSSKEAPQEPLLVGAIGEYLASARGESPAPSEEPQQ